MKLAGLGMWEEWQEKVRQSLPNFAANPIYVEQDSVPVERFEELAAKIGPYQYDPAGKVRDAQFGARVVETSIGAVTRMWLEGNVEIEFLFRNLSADLSGLRVLDVGAGYGRLAVMLAPLVKEFFCVDAVPISTTICRHYCARFAPKVQVMDLELFEEEPPKAIDLAINIHSWNECRLEQIAAWLDQLEEMRVPWLFTVSHGQLNHIPEASYRAWGKGEWRSLLKARYTLVAEESLGLSPNPHALWLRK